MHPKAELISRRFDALAPTYDDKSANRGQYLATIDDLIVNLVNERLIDTPTLLDVGTGTGTRLEALRARFPNGSVAMACDISPAMVEIAQTKNIDDVQLANMTELPYSDEQFDYLFCLFGAFGYLATEEQRTAAMNEFARVLRPNGVVVLDIINRWHKGEHLAFSKTTAKILGELSTSLINPSLRWGDVLFESQIGGEPVSGYFHTFTAKEFNKMVKGSGLSVKDKVVVGYESGNVYTENSKGNFTFVLEKSASISSA